MSQITGNFNSCLFNSFFRLITKKISKMYCGGFPHKWPVIHVCITGSLWGESTSYLVDTPHKGPVMQTAFSCYDVIMGDTAYFVHRARPCIQDLWEIRLVRTPGQDVVFVNYKWRRAADWWSPSIQELWNWCNHLDEKQRIRIFISRTNGCILWLLDFASGLCWNITICR